MASHLSTIGIKTKDKNEFNEYFEKAYERGEHIKTDKGTYVKWSMGNGVELWWQLDKKNNPIGFNPHFVGSAKMTVKITKNIVRKKHTKLDGAFYGWADPSEKCDGTFPFVFDSPDAATYGKVKLPQVVTVQLAAIAHGIEVFEDEDDFDKSQNQDAKFASESFIPCGLFNPNGKPTNQPEAKAIFNGRVIETIELINPETNINFIWAKVKTLGGEIDVIIDPTILSGKVIKGAIVSGLFWISGRIISNVEIKEGFTLKKFFNIGKKR